MDENNDTISNPLVKAMVCSGKVTFDEALFLPSRLYNLSRINGGCLITKKKRVRREKNAEVFSKFSRKVSKTTLGFG